MLEMEIGRAVREAVEMIALTLDRDGWLKQNKINEDKLELNSCGQECLPETLQ